MFGTWISLKLENGAKYAITVANVKGYDKLTSAVFIAFKRPIE